MVAEDGLVWTGTESAGWGFLPSVRSEGVYDAGYFEKYQRYAATELGARLNAFRLRFAGCYLPRSLETVVDVGIGCGQFAEARRGTLGWDVNPAGVEWLRERGLLRDPESGPTDALTFWDSLEHLESPDKVLGLCRGYVLTSVPTFPGRSAVRGSRHYRPDEHWWYFTRAGLVAFMRQRGFEVLGWSDEESRLGRESIETFAFGRVGRVR